MLSVQACKNMHQIHRLVVLPTHPGVGRHEGGARVAAGRGRLQLFPAGRPGADAGVLLLRRRRPGRRPGALPARLPCACRACRVLHTQLQCASRALSHLHPMPLAHASCALVMHLLYHWRPSALHLTLGCRHCASATTCHIRLLQTCIWALREPFHHPHKSFHLVAGVRPVLQLPSRTPSSRRPCYHCSPQELYGPLPVPDALKDAGGATSFAFLDRPLNFSQQ